MTTQLPNMYKVIKEKNVTMDNHTQQQITNIPNYTMSLVGYQLSPSTQHWFGHQHYIRRYSRH